MNLPEKFIERMKSMLSPEEFELFNASYSDEKSYGLRINPLKIKSQDALPFFLSPGPKKGFMLSLTRNPAAMFCMKQVPITFRNQVQCPLRLSQMQSPVI